MNCTKEKGSNAVNENQEMVSNTQKATGVVTEKGSGEMEETCAHLEGQSCEAQVCEHEGKGESKIGGIKNKIKDFASDALEAGSKAASKIADAAHNSAQKMEHKMS